MPKRLFFKQTDDIVKVEGFDTLSINTLHQVSITKDTGESGPLNNPNPECLSTDSEFYTVGTQSLFVTWHRGSFLIGDDAFHLTTMLTKLPTHDFYDNNVQSDMFFGIFKENGNVLDFVSAFRPLDELGINISDYISKIKSVSGLDINQQGSGYTQSYNMTTSGGSGNGLIVDLRGEVNTIDYEGVGNTFPIEGYADSTTTFLQGSTTGVGYFLSVDITFNSSGYPTYYVINDVGSDHSIGDVITTQDAGSGPLFLKITDLLSVQNVNIVSGGNYYKNGEILTINGGNGDFLLEITGVDNNNYDLDLGLISTKKIDNGIEFTHFINYNDFTNAYFKYFVELNSNGEPVSYSLISDRKISDVTFRPNQDNFFFDNNQEGAVKYWRPAEFNILGNEFNFSSGDVNNIDMFRELKWKNLSKASWSDQTIEFSQIETTGFGTGLGLNVTFDSFGSFSSCTIETIGASHSIDDVVTVRNSSSEDFFVKIETVDADGGVLTLIATGDLTPTISKYDLVRYDFLTDNIDVVIQDIEEWWNVNADEPWIIDGEIPSFKGGHIANPREALFLGSRSEDFPSSSFMISKDNFFRFSDNKMVDNQIRIFTKNKVYIGSIWVG